METTATYEPTQSSDIGKLAEALAKAQAEMEGAKKDAANPYFKSDYATLFSVWQACRGPLTKNGLSVIQTTGNGGDKITVYTILAHTSGQWIKGALSIRPAKTDPQTLGSCITYLRRYALAGMVGLSPLDDDAEAAMTEERKRPKRTEPTPEPREPWREEFESKAMAYAKKFGKEKYLEILKPFGLKSATQVKTEEESLKVFDALANADTE